MPSYWNLFPLPQLGPASTECEGLWRAFLIDRHRESASLAGLV
jgi:hypothetical protein